MAYPRLHTEFCLPDCQKDVVGGFFAGFPDAITEDLAVWRWVIRGTHTGSHRGLPPTGRSVILLGCECITAREGLVQRVEGYFDRLGMLQQLELVPAPGQAS
jgi:hypothetical protein